MTWFDVALVGLGFTALYSNTTQKNSNSPRCNYWRACWQQAAAPTAQLINIILVIAQWVVWVTPCGSSDHSEHNPEGAIMAHSNILTIMI